MPAVPFSLSLATFNVKDLFVPQPSKLRLLAELLSRADADVVGLQEVGSEEALTALVAQVSHLGYGAPLVGTADKRGIRNAILSRFPFSKTAVHVADPLPFPRFGVNDPDPFGARVALRRGIVHARVRAPPLGEVDVLCLHLKSGHPVAILDGAECPLPPATEREHAEGMVRATLLRSAEALFARGIVDGILANDSNAHVVVMGDLNDVSGSLPLRILSGRSLTSLSTLVAAEERWSLLHDGRKLELDHILATRGLAARATSASYLNGAVFDHSARSPGASDDGDSDHAPFVVRFG